MRRAVPLACEVPSNLKTPHHFHRILSLHHDSSDQPAQPTHPLFEMAQELVSGTSPITNLFAAANVDEKQSILTIPRELRNRIYESLLPGALDVRVVHDRALAHVGGNNLGVEGLAIVNKRDWSAFLCFSSTCTQIYDEANDLYRNPAENTMVTMDLKRDDAFWTDTSMCAPSRLPRWFPDILRIDMENIFGFKGDGGESSCQFSDELCVLKVTCSRPSTQHAWTVLSSWTTLHTYHQQSTKASLLAATKTAALNWIMTGIAAKTPTWNASLDARQLLEIQDEMADLHYLQLHNSLGFQRTLQAQFGDTIGVFDPEESMVLYNRYLADGDESGCTCERIQERDTMS